MIVATKDRKALVTLDMAEVVEIAKDQPTFKLAREWLNPPDEPEEPEYRYAIYVNGIHVGSYVDEESAKEEIQGMTEGLIRGANLYSMQANRVSIR